MDRIAYLQGKPAGFTDAIRLGFRCGFTYQGRASRSAYWWWLLAVWAAAIVAAVALSAAVGNSTAVSFIVVVVGIYLELVWLALAVRRLHDIDKSGWWFLIQLVPFIGGIWFLVLTLLPGTPGVNDYEPALAPHPVG
jgi:uncharacterized membrane protein YhaH (DUF805 family)